MAADLDLILYRGLALEVGGIAGIDDGAHTKGLLRFGVREGFESISDSITLECRRALSIISA